MNDILNTGYSVYQILWFFIIYCFLGWCCEVAFKSIRKGSFVNSGFLNGPVCPIYGFGIVLVLLLLEPLQKNVFLLFIGAVVLTSLLELVTGYLMNVIFHTKWWDYSKKKFNIGGYVCLQFSLIWGIGCVALLKFVQPLIETFVKIIPVKLGTVLLVIMLVGMVVDTALTAIAISSLNKELGKTTKIAQEMHKGSNFLAKNIGDKAIDVAKKVEEMNLSEKKDQLADKVSSKKDELEKSIEDNKVKLNEAIEKISSKKYYIRRRIIKAFPNMQNKKDDSILQKVKEKIKELESSKK